MFDRRRLSKRDPSAAGNGLHQQSDDVLELLVLSCLIYLLHEMLMRMVDITTIADIKILATIAVIPRANNGMRLADITNIVIMHCDGVVDFFDQLLFVTSFCTFVGHPTH